MTEQRPWQVRIALSPEETSVIETIMATHLPWERWEVRAPLIEEEGAPTLLIEVLADSRDEAEHRAATIYSQARERAGLTTQPALVLGALTPFFADAPYSRLLTEAEGHIATGRPEWAVIRVQTACEIYARLAANGIGRALPDDGREPYRLFRSMTFLDPRDRALLRALTGAAIAEQAWWRDYRLHVERRNHIVHAGISVSDEEAQASLTAAQAFIAFLQEQWSLGAET